MEGYGAATYGDRIAETYDALYEGTLDTEGAVETLAGLELRERWGSWKREPFTADSNRHVSVYAR
jgi:hypothetical protein